MSSQHDARQQSNKTRPEQIDYDDRQLETLTSRAVLKKGIGRRPRHILRRSWMTR